MMDPVSVRLVNSARGGISLGFGWNASPALLEMSPLH